MESEWEFREAIMFVLYTQSTNQENGGHAWLQSKYIHGCISWTEYYFATILALPFYGKYHAGNIAI